MNLLRNAYEAMAIALYSGTYVLNAAKRQLSYRLREWCRGNREHTN